MASKPMNIRWTRTVSEPYRKIVKIWRGRDGSKWMYGRNRCMFHYIREHENLVFYPSNNKSIAKALTSISE